MTPDRKGLYVSININEGQQYTLNSVRLQGNMAEHAVEMQKLVSLQKGDMYSASDISHNEEVLSKYLGRFGYAYPKVTTYPSINDETKQVDLVVNVEPGPRVYVRRINFSGNTITKDEVLRREMRQMEGTWLSGDKIESSKNRLEKLGFFETVDVQPQRVAGHEDLADLDVKVKEQSVGSINGGIGYGTETGFRITSYNVCYTKLLRFSSENWRRPESEVSALMELFMLVLGREIKKLHEVV